jgi:hypothetical protein
MKKLITLMSLGALLFGCAMTPNVKDVVSLQPGISKKELIERFGKEPDSVSYVDNHRILFYNVVSKSGLYQKPYYFAFKADSLVEWNACKPSTTHQTNTHLIIPFPSGE